MPCWLNHVFFWIHDHQTTIVGLPAALFSGWMVWQIRQQIEHHDKLEERRRQRKLRAKKARLPIALTEINRYADNNIRALFHSLNCGNDEQLGKLGDPQKLGPSTFGLNEYPARALTIVTDAIEDAEDSDARALSHLVSFSQVNHSRLKALQDTVDSGVPENKKTIVENEFFNSIRDILELIARVDCCYGYARGMNKHIDPFPEFHNFARYEPELTDLEIKSRLNKYLKEHWQPDWGTLIAERSLQTLND